MNLAKNAELARQKDEVAYSLEESDQGLTFDSISKAYFESEAITEILRRKLTDSRDMFQSQCLFLTEKDLLSDTTRGGKQCIRA